MWDSLTNGSGVTGGYTGSLYSPYHHDDEIQQVPAIPQVRIRVTQQPVCNNFQKCFNRKNDQKEILHPFLDRQNRDKEDISSLIASAVISLSIKPLEALNQHQKMYWAICLGDILLQIRPIRKKQTSHTHKHTECRCTRDTVFEWIIEQKCCVCKCQMNFKVFADCVPTFLWGSKHRHSSPHDSR